VALAAGESVVATGRNRTKLLKTYSDLLDHVFSLELDVSEEANDIVALDAAVAPSASSQPPQNLHLLSLKP
jgi:hypothetical protein